MALDKEVLQRDLHAACRQQGRNVEFQDDHNNDGFFMRLTPSTIPPVFISAQEMVENDDMGGFIALVLADAGIN